LFAACDYVDIDIEIAIVVVVVVVVDRLVIVIEYRMNFKIVDIAAAVTNLENFATVARLSVGNVWEGGAMAILSALGCATDSDTYSVYVARRQKERERARE